MILLGLIICPVFALLALLGLYAVTDRQPGRYVLPAVRTTALLAVAVTYAAVLFAR